MVLRGDANNDGIVDEEDVAWILEANDSGEQLICPAAADANTDGNVDYEDASYLLSWLHSEGAPPAECREVELVPDLCHESFCEG